MIPKPQPNRSISPSPDTGQTSLPPTSFRSPDQSTPRQHSSSHRRHSDRIRSPSDSSSSDEEGQAPHRLERQTSAPPIPVPFPNTGTSKNAQNRPLPPRRTKTLSDPSRLDSPLAMRIRGGVNPPSAFANGSFARPSPASRRRRGSAGASPEDDIRSPELEPRAIQRSTSTLSMGRSAKSPTWESDPKSPTSPTGLDHTSFHDRAKSPETDGEEEEPQGSIGSSYGDEPSGVDEIEELEDVVDREFTGKDMVSRLSRISVSHARTIMCLS
jgi:hypothetical protein